MNFKSRLRMSEFFKKLKVEIILHKKQREKYILKTEQNSGN